MSRKLFLGFLIAVATMAGTGFVILRYAGGYRHFWVLSRQISPGHWAILVCLTILFYLMDYARYYTLFSLCGVKLPLSLGFQLTAVSYFVSTLTPGSELYIPAVIFLVGRKGISASHAAAVTMIKPFYLTAWVCLIGFSTLWWRNDVHLPEYLAHHLSAGLLPFGLLILTFAYVIFYPDQFLGWTSRQLSRKNTPWWKKKALSGLANCAQAISTIGKSTRPMHLMAHGASILFILVYAAVGYVLAHAVGIPLSAGKALTIFSNSLMVCYLAPSPAGMGITEMATSYLLNPAMPQNAMVIGTLLRFLCWYIVVIPGFFILAYTLDSEGIRRFFKSGAITNQS